MLTHFRPAASAITIVTRQQFSLWKLKFRKDTERTEKTENTEKKKEKMIKKVDSTQFYPFFPSSSVRSL
jgi:hypothetical protein